VTGMDGDLHSLSSTTLARVKGFDTSSKGSYCLLARFFVSFAYVLKIIPCRTIKSAPAGQRIVSGSWQKVPYSVS
jgi:hypothetical protein